MTEHRIDTGSPEERVKQLREALEAIRYALGDERNEGVPGWRLMREFLNRRGIYNDDLNDNRVVLAVIDAALEGTK